MWYIVHCLFQSPINEKLFFALKNITFSDMMLGRMTVILSVPQKTLSYKFLNQWFYDPNDIVKVWLGLTRDCGFGENDSLVDHRMHAIIN